tara:strand:+ start:171 stop:962 length:792 start_codon:yes stop_codon:yes gene_type:complete
MGSWISTPDPNGTYFNGEYFNAGSGTWSALTSGWSGFTDWGQAPTDLVYAKTYDFGTAKPVIPTVVINTKKGNAKTQIKFGNSIDGDNHVIIPYVSNQTMTLYCDLDYYVSGYVEDSTPYAGATARYAEVIVTVAARDSSNNRITAVLSDVIAEFDQRLEHEYFFDIDTTDLAGSTAARTIPVQTLSTPVAGIYYSTKYDETTSAANGKYVIHTVSKSTPSFTVRDLDAFPEDTQGVDHDGIDIDVVGFPILTVTEGGGIGRA